MKTKRKSLKTFGFHFFFWNEEISENEMFPLVEILNTIEGIETRQYFVFANEYCKENSIFTTADKRVNTM